MYFYKEIDRELYLKLLQLRAAPGVRECGGYRSLALTQAMMREDCVVLAVCAGDAPVGYLEYTVEPTGRYRLHTLFAAEGGHSERCRREALQHLTGRATEDEGCPRVAAWPRREETPLYESLGFTATGRMAGFELEMTFECPPKAAPKPLLREAGIALITLLLRGGLRAQPRLDRESTLR